MADIQFDFDNDRSGELSWPCSGRISVAAIAERLSIGRETVYSMLERAILPGVRLGRRWIITRHAYLQWERTADMRGSSGLPPHTEVRVT